MNYPATWPRAPVIYEINTWVWLNELSLRHQRPISLATVPQEEWEALGSLNIDVVWLMGVWERSPAGRRIARENQGLVQSGREALPDLTEADIVGSPYCVRHYEVDEHLGGTQGLAVARQKLAELGLRLLLDLVPNHVAPDHPWVREDPEYFIQGTPEDLAHQPEAFFRAGDHILAYGRDPYFPPWPDVIQVNAYSPGLRRATMDVLFSMAEQCDGVRCDMAMLLVNRVFQRTWGKRAGEPPVREFWEEIISAVRKKHPQFLFMAEVYWDMEWELQQQGFNYCYDKVLYDRLLRENAESVRMHLGADLSFQEKLVRFIENHDEPRAAVTFGPQQARAAAVTIATLPGARLFHEGQFEGRKIKLPVFLGRRPSEPIDQDLRAFYRNLLQAVADPVVREGEWGLCQGQGWPTSSSYFNLVAWGWRQGDARRLVVVNLSPFRSQGRIQAPWEDLAGRTWQLADALSGALYERDGGEMLSPGLFVDLEAWQFHFFKIQ